MENEAGAADNRLSLVPSQFGVEDWEDGKKYTFSEVTVRQVSPGEFEVLSATPGEGPTAEAEGGQEEGEVGDSEAVAPEQEVAGNYPNPAIERLMRKR